MTAPRSALYSRDILALAVELARYPLADDAALSAQVRSRTCGSTLMLSAGRDSDGALTTLGLRVAACAVGQAAAAIFASAAEGRSAADMAAAEQGIASWLAGQAERPLWPRLDLLEPALAFPARHEAILLPWRGALAALSNPARRR